MAVGNVDFPEMNKVSGIKLGTCNAGIKQTERDDILVVEMTEGTTCAGVFTQNSFCAAPVVVAKDHLNHKPKWLLVNSGNANAGTGKQGMDDALSSCSALASLSDENQSRVLPFSTGVIGENLPIEKIQGALPKAVNALSEDNWYKASRAIMTTDTVNKGASVIIDIEGSPVTITGISKGSGMIHPNMATMLSFIATDANVSQELLQQCISGAAESSFNKITIDGDTSTNDACILMASGCSSAPEIIKGAKSYEVFESALNKICMRLAELIVRDGEGATKLMRIRVEQASSSEEAIRVAKIVALSPLVKTAFFASDPNWGRILAAVGRSEINNLDLDEVEIYLNEVCIVNNAARAASYTEKEGQKVMDQAEILVRIVLARGEIIEEVLTCDFSYDYVRINAEYRT